MNITVYCSSRSGLRESFDESAIKIGSWIGENHHTLIYGGIGIGDMKLVAESCKNAGGKVIGVVPSSRHSDKWDGNEENLFPEDLNQRKDIMINLGERFIALPGGYGTLDEILATLAMMSFTITDPARRIMIVNIDGIYDHLIDQFEKMADIGLLDRKILTRIEIVSSTAEALEHLPQFCR